MTLFEAADYPGGHTNTVAVEREHGTWHIDTGFVVLNDRNYPRFRALLRDAGVALQPTHMGFSVHAEEEDFEYAGTPRGGFCQHANLRRPAFWRMLADLVRLNRDLRGIVSGASCDDRSLAQFVAECGYSRWFAERLIVPQVRRSASPPIPAADSAHRRADLRPRHTAPFRAKGAPHFPNPSGAPAFGRARQRDDDTRNETASLYPDPRLDARCAAAPQPSRQGSAGRIS